MSSPKSLNLNFKLYPRDVPTTVALSLTKPTVNKPVQHIDGGLEQALRTEELDVMVLASCESKWQTLVGLYYVHHNQSLT
jgi:hypothetical protein